MTDDATLERVGHHLARAAQQAVHLQTVCFEKGEQVLKGYNASNMPGIHPIARDRFLAMTKEFEREFAEHLTQLVAGQAAVLEARQQLAFFRAGDETSASDTVTSLFHAQRLSSEEFTNIALGTAVANTNFGSSLQSFMDANGELFDRLRASGMLG